MNSAACPVVLFHSPPDHLEALARDCWKRRRSTGRERRLSSAIARRTTRPGSAFRQKPRALPWPGSSVFRAAWLWREIDGAGLHAARRIARELRMKAVEISPDAADLFDAAVTLGSAAITPLIDRAAALLRDAGIGDPEAARIASSLFEQTARDYAHSGKQSWAWYGRKPLIVRLKAQIASAGPELEPVLRQLLVFGFRDVPQTPGDWGGTGLHRKACGVGLWPARPANGE